MIILKCFLEQIQCGDEENSALVCSVHGDSGTLDYVKVWGFPDPIVSTS
jgi:hypothetical protein